MAAGSAPKTPHYAIRFKPAAERDLRKVKDRRTLKRIVDAIAALESDPRPAGIKALQGDSSILRMRVGDYRILSTVVDAELLILVASVGHRREVYR